MSTENQYSREGDNHQRDVVEFARVVGAAIQDNRDNEDEQTSDKRDAGFCQAHASTLGPGRVVGQLNCNNLMCLCVALGNFDLIALFIEQKALEWSGDHAAASMEKIASLERYRRNSLREQRSIFASLSRE